MEQTKQKHTTNSMQVCKLNEENSFLPVGFFLVLIGEFPNQI